MAARPSRRGAPARPERFGYETPRVFTPPLRRLTERTSYGHECIAFARDVLGIELLPWQKWLLIHALEVAPGQSTRNGAGNFRFRKIVLLVGRQNGKSLVLQVLALWRLYLDGGNLVIGTAQNLDVADEVWQGAVDMAQESSELEPEIAKVDMTKGRKCLHLAAGQRYKVATASRRGGRGLSGELILLDELREHQSWDAWAAVTKTTNARERAQIWCASNAGDASSIVLRYLRKQAHLALGDPDGLGETVVETHPEAELDDAELDELEDEDTLAVFEWSAPPKCRIRDRAGWAQANPALGHMISERVLAGDAKTDPEWVFRTEVLCQWWDGAAEGPFPAGAWEKSLDEGSTIATGSPAPRCVDVSWDRTAAHIGVAGWRDDGLAHVEVIASRSGTDWVVGWFTDPERPDRMDGPVVVQSSGAPVSSLAKPLRDAGLEVVEWSGPALGIACGGLYDAVRAAVGEGSGEAGLRHRTQPVLDVAAATAATRPLGDAWVWDRKKSPADAAPIVCVTGAYWQLTSGEGAPAPEPDIF